MNRSRIIILSVCLVLLAAGVATAWLLPSEEETAGLLRSNNAGFVTIGKRVYKENCASCHGVNLEGQVADWKSPGPDGKLPAPPHDETGHTWHHADQLLFNITKLGLAKSAGLENYDSAMPIYEDVLTDKEIIAVLSYIKSTWPQKLQERHDELNKRMQEQK